MPRNPHKRPCQVPGCKAWAKHGKELCAAHLHSQAIGGDATRVLPLLRLTAAADPPSTMDSATVASGALSGGALSTGGELGSDLALIEEELRQLVAARALFMDWLRDLRAEENPERPTVTPTQFLRAWSDSATRVVQLLRARAELRGGDNSALGALLDSVYDELDALLQADPADAGATEEVGDDHTPR